MKSICLLESICLHSDRMQTNTSSKLGHLGLLPSTRKKCPFGMPEAHLESVLHCPSIGSNADERAVVSASAIYLVRAAAYAGKFCFRI